MMPVLIVLLFGTVEFSVMFYDKAVITNASREGARYGVVNRSPYATSAQITTYVQTYCATNLVSFSKTATSPTVVVTSSTNPAVFGSQLTVTVNYVYTFLILPKLLGFSATNTLTSTS